MNPVYLWRKLTSSNKIMMGVFALAISSVLFVWHLNSSVTSDALSKARVRPLTAAEAGAVGRSEEFNSILLALAVGGLVMFSGRMLHVTEKEALSDALTGLPNRRAFMDAVSRESSRSKRSKREFAVVMLDIDKFKAVNDTHGHDTGDAVLQTVAKRMAASVRPSDFIARLGGEEFVILMPETGADTAMHVVERLRKDVSMLRVRATPELSVSPTVSGGVAAYPHDGECVEELFAQADKALYAAKDRGRNRVFAVRQLNRRHKVEAYPASTLAA